MSEVKWDSKEALELADRCERQHDAIHTPGHQAAKMLRDAVREIERVQSVKSHSFVNAEQFEQQRDTAEAECERLRADLVKALRDRLAADNATLRADLAFQLEASRLQDAVSMRRCRELRLARTVVEAARLSATRADEGGDVTLLEKTQEFIRFVEENNYGRVVEIRLDPAAYMVLEHALEPMLRFHGDDPPWAMGIVFRTAEGETRIKRVEGC